MDEFGESLTDAQIKKLDEDDIRKGISEQMLPGFGYSASDIHRYENGSGKSNVQSRANNSHYLVTHVVWKSMKKIGFVSYPDEFGDEESGIVDETFKLDDEMKQAGYSLEWRWIPEVWHGTKIGDDMFVDIEPMPNQSRSMDNPSEVKLPYIGRIYNATNSYRQV